MNAFESPGPMESRSGRSVAERIQLGKVVGMPLAKADQDRLASVFCRRTGRSEMRSDRSGTLCAGWSPACFREGHLSATLAHVCLGKTEASRNIFVSPT